MIFETINAYIEIFLTIHALNFSWILINIYTMSPSHIMSNTARIVLDAMCSTIQGSIQISPNKIVNLELKFNIKGCD
jgi:hypothetical protein